MLVNENICLEKCDDRLYLVGLDDCHYFGTDDLVMADAGISKGTFKIMLCHTPERFREAAAADYSLYLTGHTHGGQICFPSGKTVIMACTAVPHRMAKGLWQYQNLKGYTSRGVGSSGVPVRYFCPPEITFITLKCAR